MTAIERTEELVQNLLIAQNELIVHLGIIKGIPHLARVLFGPVEKNLNIEKNSSEMEKIRQTWMDDVVLLASEFFVNEEAFNLENLTELLKATVGAITDILAIGPEENSVDQTEKKFTFLDKFKEDNPNLVIESDEYLMMRYCVIAEFGYGERCPYKEGTISECCRECWSQEYKPTPVPENWTCIDQLAVDHPDYVNEKYLGGASGCPWVYDYNERRLCEGGTTPASHIEANEQCRRCWKQPYKPQD